MGLAGMGTAGRSSGGGIATTTRFLVGLGEGDALGDALRLDVAVGLAAVASLAAGDPAALPDRDVSAEGVGASVMDGAAVGPAVGCAPSGDADDDVDAGIDDRELDGAPDGVAEQATITPAQARAPTSSIGRRTPTGYVVASGPSRRHASHAGPLRTTASTLFLQ